MNSKYLINNSVEYHVESHTLTPRDDATSPVVLNTPASRCLLLLIQRRHTIISQDVFLEEVWKKHGAHVSANTFYQNISILRKGLTKVGLGDEIVKTIPRKGLTLTDSTKIVLLTESKPLGKAAENAYRSEERVASVPLHSVNQKENNNKGSCENKNKRDVSVRYKKGCISFSLPTTLILFSLIIASLPLTSFWAKRTSYFQKYTQAQNESECVFFSESNARAQDNITDIIKNNKVNCRPDDYRYYYITSFPFTERISIIMCNKDINSASRPRCLSTYYLQ